MIYKLRSLEDPLLSLIKDDPVRPEIPLDFRVTENREVLVLMQDEKPLAVVCVAYMDDVPSTTTELFKGSNEPTAVIFYTIWSYAPGAGRKLIMEARDDILKSKPSIKRFVTLSPPTEIGRAHV